MHADYFLYRGRRTGWTGCDIPGTRIATPFVQNIKYCKLSFAFRLDENFRIVLIF
jgi:hypothetical protein